MLESETVALLLAVVMQAPRGHRQPGAMLVRPAAAATNQWHARSFKLTMPPNWQ